MKQGPVFIVGAPRSGTTLLAAMLDAHSRLSCGPETHFFRRLAQVDVPQLLVESAWPDAAVNFIAAIEHTSSLGDEKKFLLNKYQLHRDDITRYLADKPPRVAYILAAVTEQKMRRQGKERWVEKTPDHLEYVRAIRTYFPDSPIIRIVRDPRDVSLSLTKVPWGTDSIVESFLYLRRLDENSANFFAIDQNAYTLHYEHLVAEPEQTLKALCQFLGEAFEESMLDTSQTGERINSRNAPWKNKVSQPLDRSRVAVWRRDLTPVEKRLAEALVGDQIAAYGYTLEEGLDRLATVFPNMQLLGKYSNRLGAIVAAGVRFWPAEQSEEPAVQIYLGNPGDEIWLGTGRWSRLRQAWRLGRWIAQSAAAKKQIFWLADDNAANWSGLSAQWVKKRLRTFGQTIEEDEA